jgi:hypothetical protein
MATAPALRAREALLGIDPKRGGHEPIINAEARS